MKQLYNRIKVAALVFGIGFFFACGPLPKLSKCEKRIIRNVVRAPVPEIVEGETGFASSQDHSIWYERIHPDSPSQGVVLLIMGNGNDALSWPASFVSALIAENYEVVRFDHRGTGLSTSTKKWKKKDPYSLHDMAGDVIAILDALNIEKAHIVGASMGGMIAQIVAIEYPKRTASLTSIMSSGHVQDPELPPMSNEVVPKMVGAIFKYGFFGNKKGQIKRQIVQKKVLMGEATETVPIKSMAETSLYNLKKRDGYKLLSARHHYEAILNAGSRYEALSRLTIPTLLIHGVQDPVIPISHGKKLATLMSQADTLWIANMGHDFPEAALPKIVNALVSTFEPSSEKNSDR